jgi:cell division protein FtsL
MTIRHAAREDLCATIIFHLTRLRVIEKKTLRVDFTRLDVESTAVRRHSCTATLPVNSTHMRVKE